jgi:hypothetical protein
MFFPGSIMNRADNQIRKTRGGNATLAVLREESNA